jgi:protein translocase SecG subunit
MTATEIIPYIQIILSILLVGGILIQKSEAGLGGAFGGDSFSSVHNVKRGAEKTVFIITIVLAILFALSSFILLVI